MKGPALRALLAAILLSPLATTTQAAPAPPEPNPDPQFILTPSSGTTATEFVADARGSFIPTGASLVWDWGDGTVEGGGKIVRHHYQTAGDKIVTLTITTPGGAQARALAALRVLSEMPTAATHQEAEALADPQTAPNNAIEIVQRAPLSLPSPGLAAVLVDGLSAAALPALAPLGPLNLTYLACDDSGCATGDYVNASDPTGGTTGAFSVLLQAALNASYVVYDVSDGNGTISLHAVVSAMGHAVGIDADVVISLLPPEAGFYDLVQPRTAADPYSAVSSYRTPSPPSATETEALLRALVQNRAGYFYGSGTYPAPNNFNESRPLPGHGSAGHGGHGGHGGSHGGGHDHGGDGHHGRALGHDHQSGQSLYGQNHPHTGCAPLPVAGPRSDTEGMASYGLYEPSIRLLEDLIADDLSILSPSEARTLLTVGHAVMERACLDLTLSALVHAGIPVVAPAGDAAEHVGVAQTATAVWDAQSLRGLAEFPQVITVGATTSTFAPEGPPHHGTKRVVLPTSGAGPAPSLYGVKPDVLAPGDLPAAMLLGGPGYEPAERYNLVDRFDHNRTTARLLQPDRVTFANNEARVSPFGGLVYESSHAMPLDFRIQANVGVVTPDGSEANGALWRLQAREGPPEGLRGAGVGFDIQPEDSVLVLTTHVWGSSGAETPVTPVCVARTGCTNPDVSVRAPREADLILTIEDSGQVTEDEERLIAFHVADTNGALYGTVLRRATLGLSGKICACDVLSFEAVWADAAGSYAVLDDVTAKGISRPARAEYLPELPVNVPGYASGVRPSTRIAAAYVGALLLADSAFSPRDGSTGIEKVQRVRGSLLAQAQRLDGVPAFVQGAGEVAPELRVATTALGETLAAPNVPGVDFGLRGAPGANVTVSFRSSAFLPSDRVVLDVGSLAWTRVDQDARIYPAGAEKPSLRVDTVASAGDVRTIRLNLTALPARHGVYSTHVPVRVQAVDGVENPLHRPYTIPVVVTRGLDLTLDVSASPALRDRSYWLLPTSDAERALVHAPLLAGPSASTNANGGLASFGLVAPAVFALATPTATSLPIPVAAGAPHEAGRLRDFAIVAPRITPLAHGTTALATLAPGAALPVPVAFRFLDVVQGGDFATRPFLPPTTVESGVAASESFGPELWNRRGDDRPTHARDEPLPLGDTTRGWDVRTLGRAPPEPLGPRSPADARLIEEASLAGGFEHTALAGHLDPRPYLIERDGLLPWLRLTTSFPLPRPIEDVHGVLQLPLLVEEGTAVVTLEAGGRRASYVLTIEGALLPVSEEGTTFAHDHGGPDRIDDGNHAGLLSGHGHRHSMVGHELRLIPPTPYGHLIPVGFHDLNDTHEALNLTIVVKPDATILSARALGADPLDPAPGARFRLDSAALYAWTHGRADLVGSRIDGIRAGPLARFAAGTDAVLAPAIRFGTAPAETANELLELYVRGRTGLTLQGDAAVPAPHNGLRRAPVADNHTLQYAFGRAMGPIVDPMLHPAGVLDAYGRPSGGLPFRDYPDAIPFRSVGGSLWQIDRLAISEADPDGDVSLVFSDALPAAGPPVEAVDPFPDMADPQPPAAPEGRICYLPSLSAYPDAIYVSTYGGRGCLEDLLEIVDGRSGAVTDRSVRSTLANYSAFYGRAANVSLYADVSTPCLDGYPERPGPYGESSCAGALVEGVAENPEDVDDRILRLRLRSDPPPLPPSTFAGTVPGRFAIYQGTIPAPGALLLLEHAMPATGDGSAGWVEVAVAGTPPRRITTIEGADVLTPTRATRGPTILDALDLVAFVGLDVRIDLVAEGPTPWSITSARVVPRAPDAPAERVDVRDLHHSDSPARPTAALASTPEPAGPHVVTVGPREAARAQASTATVVYAPAGLHVEGPIDLSGKWIVLGRDLEGAVLRVTSTGNLTLDGAVVSPRNVRAPSGVHVERGGLLQAAGATFLGGGTAASRGAAIHAEGDVTLSASDVLGARIGVRVGPEGTLTATGGTIARNLVGLALEGGTATLTDVHVAANIQGVRARDATLSIVDGLYTGNRESALALQDTLAAIEGATFAWNGEAGHDAAIRTVEGYDTGRVVAHDLTMLANGRAADARAPLDLHLATIRQAAPTAIAIGPGTTVRLDHVDVRAADRTVHVDVDATLEASIGTIRAEAGSSIACSSFGAPRSIVLDDVVLVRPILGCGPGVTSRSTLANATDDSRWRATVARPFLRLGENPALHLNVPPGEANLPGGPVRLVAADGNDLAGVAVAADAVSTAAGADWSATYRAAPPGEAPQAHAWSYAVVRDSTPPQGSANVPAVYVAPDGKRYANAVSLPLTITATDPGPDSSGLRSTTVFLDTLRPDGTRGLTANRALQDARGLHLAMGLGSLGSLPLATGESATVTPELRDRAGNAANGTSTSFVFDRTPPRGWIHAENPCGNLVGYDLRWHGHDPVVGSGFRPTGWTYVVSLGKLDLAGLVAQPRPLPRVALDPIRIDDPQAVNGALLSAIEANVERALESVEIPIHWQEIARVPWNVDSMRYRPAGLPDAERFPVPLSELELTDLAALRSAAEAWLEQEKQSLLAAIQTVDDVGAIPTPEALLAGRDAALDNLAELVPIVLMVRLEVRDAVGNTAFAYEPVVTDVLSPTALFYHLGDTLRERVMPVVLSPSAHVDLDNLHGEISWMDVECGLRKIEFHAKEPADQAYQHLVTEYPRAGRLADRIESLADRFPADACGPRQLLVTAEDVYGRTTLTSIDTILDRVPPLSLITGWERVGIVPPIPGAENLPLPPPTVQGTWIDSQGIRVHVHSESRNLGACTPAALHDVRVEGRLDGGAWATLARVHVGPGAGNDVEDVTLEVAADSQLLGLDDQKLSGRDMHLRVVATDEAGREEIPSAFLTVRPDHVPPLCTIEEILPGGIEHLPVRWRALDGDQAVGGAIVETVLLVRRAGMPIDEPWVYFAHLPSPIGAMNATLGNENVPAWLREPVARNVEVACAAYDEAGNLAIGDALGTVLDLEVPLVQWKGLPPPAFSWTAVVYEWTVQELATGIDKVVVLAGNSTENLTIQATFGAQPEYTWTLDPEEHDLSSDASWTVFIEAHDLGGNVGTLTHDIIFDFVAPIGDLDDLVLGLVDGWLTRAGFHVVPNVQNVGSGEHSPLAPKLRVVDPSGTREIARNPDGSFDLTFQNEGDYVVGLLPCDQAGNCQPTWTNAAVRIDLTPPTASLHALAQVPPIAGTLHGRAVSWIPAAVTSTVRALDRDGSGATTLASGVASVHVFAQPLDPQSLADAGAHSSVKLSTTTARLTTHDAEFPYAPTANKLYRYEAVVVDRVGNRLELPGGDPVALNGLFAHDATPPVATLQDLPDYTNDATKIVLVGTLRDDATAVESGPSRVEGFLTIGNEPPALVGTATGLSGAAPPYSITPASVPPGLLLTYCVVGVDLAGNRAPCAGATTTIFDTMAHDVEIIPPADVGPGDPWTKLPTVDLGVRIREPALPGTAVSPLRRAFLDTQAGDTGVMPIRSLVPADDLVAPGDTRTYPVSFPGLDANEYVLRASAEDAAGNERPIATSQNTGVPRRTIEAMLFRLDSNWNDDAGGPAMSQGTTNRRPAAAVGKHAGGYSFDGASSHADSIASSLQTLGDKLSVTLWVNPTTTGQHALLATRFNTFELRLVNGVPRASLTTCCWFTRTLDHNAALPINTWTHLALTYDGANIRFYVNGNETDVEPHTGPLYNPAQQVQLGSNSNSYNGLITMDEFRVYRAALSPDAIRDVSAKPYRVLAPSAETTIRIDRTAPDSRPIQRALTGATTLGHVSTDGVGLVSGVASLQLDGRILDGSAYTPETATYEPGVLEMRSIVGTAAPAGHFSQVAQTMSFPPTPTEVAIEVTVNDNIADGQVANGCTPNESLIGAAKWYVMINGAAVHSQDVAIDGTAPQRVRVSAVLSGNVPIGVGVNAVGPGWKTCYPQLVVQFDELRVSDVAGTTYAHEPFDNHRDWSVGRTATFAAPTNVVRTVRWGAGTAPNLLHAESWPEVTPPSTQGWDIPATARDPLTSVSDGTGIYDTRSLTVTHQGGNAAVTTRDVELAGKTLTTPLDAGIITLAGRYAVTGTTTVQSHRIGLQVDFGPDRSIVYAFSNLGSAIPTEPVVDITGHTTHYFAKIQTNNTVFQQTLDLAADKATAGITGPITAIHLRMEKHASSLNGGNFFLEAKIDDLQLLREKRTRVDLDFLFPFYGARYSTLYVDDDGVIGFEPDFNDAASVPNLQAQRLIAPYWGAWSLYGVQEPAFVHQILVDESVPDQVTLQWVVGSEANPAVTYRFATVLTRAGEIYVKYDPSTTFHPTAATVVGVSDGLGNSARYATPPSPSTSRTDSLLPAGGFVNLATTTPAAPWTLPPHARNWPLYLRSQATDVAGNVEPATSTVESRVYADTAGPEICLAFAKTGGKILDNVLRVVTCALDPGAGITPGNVTLVVRDVTTGDSQTFEVDTNDATGLPWAPGVTIVHRHTYNLTLTARDTLGNTRSASIEEELVIEPEPTLDLARLLRGAIIVDDELIGTAEGPSRFVGTAVTLRGRATVEDGEAQVEVLVNGTLVYRGDPGAEIPFGTRLDLSSYGGGEHELTLRAVTPAGSFNSTSLHFTTPGNPLIVSNGVETEAGWSFESFTNGESSARTAASARTLTAGAEILAIADANNTPVASFALPREVEAGHYWAYARAEVGAGSLLLFDARGDAGTAFALRANAGTTTLPIDVYASGAWTSTGKSILARSWTRIEAVDDGAHVTILADGLPLATVARDAGNVTSLAFGAGSAGDAGALFVDDVGASLADPLARHVLFDTFTLDMDGWTTTGTVVRTNDPQGQPAIHVGTGAGTSEARYAVEPLGGQLWASANVGRFGGSCPAEANIVRLVDATGATVAGLRCGATALEARNGAGWSATDASALAPNQYTRVRFSPGPGSYTLFLDEVPIGDFTLGTKTPVVAIVLGGAGVDLWYDGITLERGRTLHTEGFESENPTGWVNPGSAGGITLDLEGTRALTGRHAAFVRSTGAFGEAGALTFTTAFPTLFRFEEWVYIKPVAETTYDEMYAFLFEAVGTPRFGIGVKSVTTGLGPPDQHRWGFWNDGTFATQTLLTPGWHLLGAAVDQDNDRWAPRIDGVQSPWRSFGTNVPPLELMKVGDVLNPAIATQPSGAGEISVDDLTITPINRDPVYAIDPLPNPDASGRMRITGTSSDADFVDDADRLEYTITGPPGTVVPRQPFPKGPTWEIFWETAGLPAGKYFINVYAVQGGISTPSQQRSYTIT